ncbi:undecaprenyl-phosphate glucose phosphotransferase [Pseudomonas multiresinivorans]|uniref:Undecaprenyl-phosphate glucose phosphotransferase n=1 Tax=Pseudomonas multiresinivorans TaxID=95301 RepID=A0A7Z3GT78_9PSED|nr:undecaprenyl-phosphate glucose phosphotransferase [Pseudomonas multiresinivorans]QJP10955.1 undecaprenyl-phosphate glucose phosphotransferase [Pseudomonas multiresinivorans]
MNRNDRGVLRPPHTSLSILQRTLDLAIILLCIFLLCTLSGIKDSRDILAVAFGTLLPFSILADAGGLYGSWRGKRIRDELRKLSCIWLLSSLTFFLGDYVLFESQPRPRMLLIQLLSFPLITLIAYRVFLRQALKILRNNGLNTRNVAIVGAGPLGARLAMNIANAPWMGLELLGFYDDERTTPVQLPGWQLRISVSGNLEQLISEAHSGSIDHIYIALPMRSEARIKWLVDQLSDTTVSVHLVPDVFIFNLLHARSQNIDGIPTISIFDSPMVGASALVKRLEDIILSSLILCLIAVPMLFISAAIKLTSPGPVFFRQKRYGIDGRSIEVWKFRSMRVMENGAKVTQATRNDSRITPLGAFLRRTSLDELPQFINVLMGDMSIVGPRPHAIAHNEEYRGQISSYMLRHKVKPGITGWAQVNGWRGETDTLEKMQKRVEFDLAYINNWSLWWDLKIVFLTLFKGFVHKNAY